MRETAPAPIVDGFSMNARLIYMADRFYPLALHQMETLRRKGQQGTLRARWYAIPSQVSVPIAPLSTLQQQVRIIPGSWLWGYNFQNLTVDANPTDMQIQITDAMTEMDYFSSPIFPSGITPGPLAKLRPILLCEPRLVAGDGLLNVKIANLTQSDRQAQLVLHFAEPCIVLPR